MKPLGKEDFERLSNVHKAHCISIYFPTHRGAEGGEGMYKDKTELKNQLKIAEKQLKLFEMKDSEIERYLKPIEELSEDKDLWKHLSDTLAIFYDGENLEYHALPIHYPATTYVNNHFFLKPLSEWVNRNMPWFILNLNLNGVQLLEADLTSLYKVKVKDLIPIELKEAVGFDYEEKHLQRRSEQGESGDADGIYHGQGMSNDNIKKEEAKQFFQKVDRGLATILKQSGQPLILSGVDYICDIYREVNSYQNLMEEQISGSESEISLDELHDKSARIIQKHLDREVADKKLKFEAMAAESKADSSIDKIIPAAIAGRVETLYLLKDESLWGKYLKDEHKIETDTVRDTTDSELLNLAAIKTINQDGEVVLVDEESDLPAKVGSANAIFRYARAS